MQLRVRAPETILTEKGYIDPAALDLIIEACETKVGSQWVYTVLFEGRELWRENADPSLKVSFEAFEPYLDPA